MNFHSEYSSFDSQLQNLGMIQFSIGAIACVMWLMVKSRSYVADKMNYE